MNAVVIRASLLLLALGCGACATVQPYQRETLARSDMQLERNGDLSAGEEHATAYREGSSGAVGASGGGCGCN
ncbi:MAG: DUF4266 domain-containing protein [Polyangiales bacterium]